MQMLTYETGHETLQGGRVYGLPAVKDSHSVTVTFQLPSLQAAYAAKASR